jgi:hypothetical protein
MLLTGPLAENYGFPTVLVLTTGLVLVASPLAWMLKETPRREPIKGLTQPGLQNK